MNCWMKTLVEQARGSIARLKQRRDAREADLAPERVSSRFEALEPRLLFSADLSIASVYADGEMMIDYDVAGQDASAFDLSVYRSSDGVTLGDLVATQRIDSAADLAVGSHTQSLATDVLGEQAGAQLIVVIDAADEIAEPDESNNTAVFAAGDFVSADVIDISQATGVVDELANDQPIAVIDAADEIAESDESSSTAVLTGGDLVSADVIGISQPGNADLIRMLRTYPPPGVSGSALQALISSLMLNPSDSLASSSIPAATPGTSTMAMSSTSYTAAVTSPCSGNQTLDEVIAGRLYSGSVGSFTLSVLSLNTTLGQWFLTIYDYGNPTGGCYPFAQFGQVTANSSDPTGVYGLMVGGSPNTSSGTANIT